MVKRVNSLLFIFIIVSCLICFKVWGNDTETDAILTEPMAKLTKCKIPMADPVGIAQGAKILPEDTLVASNNNFELYLNDKDLVIKVKDKSNGYVWSSAAQKDKMQSLNFEWQRIATSLLTMDYLNPAGSVSRSPLKHSSAKTPRITKTSNGFSADLEFYEAKIGLTVQVELTDYGIKVSVPDESIIQKGDNILHKLYIMPFLGAAHADEMPGYVFIPDGSGALIRFAKPRPYISAFSERVYGLDYGMKRPHTRTLATQQTDRMRLNMPVFGVAHGGRQNAFLAVVTSGDVYMDIHANPAGSTVDYTWVCASFTYRDQYIQPTSKSGGGFTALQPHNNTVNASIEYIFLSGEDADYVGMAKAYREKLKKDGMLASTLNPASPIKLKLEVVMAEPKKGLISNRLEVMTKLADVERWVEELYNNGVPNTSVVLWGYERGGVNGHKLNDINIDSAVGNMDEMQKLSNMLASKGGELVLKKEIQCGYEKQIDKSRLAYHIDGGIIEKIDTTKPMFNNMLFQNLQGMQHTINQYTENPNFMKNIALSSISENLFSDFRRNNVIYRHEMKEKISKILDTARKDFNMLAIYSPNVYAFQYADAIYDVPMQHSQFAFETDTVPFIQIVLSGSKEYYAPHLNFGANAIEDVLKLIDYGAYPSYILTEQYSNKLASTNLNYIYSSRYDDWKGHIIDTYNTIKDILSKVKGKAINKRTIPADGIVIVEYEGGITILINYTDRSWKYNNYTINGKSAKILGN